MVTVFVDPGVTFRTSKSNKPPEQLGAVRWARHDLRTDSPTPPLPPPTSSVATEHISEPAGPATVR